MSVCFFTLEGMYVGYLKKGYVYNDMFFCLILLFCWRGLNMFLGEVMGVLELFVVV